MKKLLLGVLAISLINFSSYTKANVTVPAPVDQDADVQIISQVNALTHRSNTILADIQFWLQQWKEHVEFIVQDFIKDTKLINHGNALRHEIEVLQNTLKTNKHLQRDVVRLGTKLIKYQCRVKHHLKKKKKNPEGIALALLNHMTRETKYAQDKARGRIFTREEEALFWGVEHKDQASIMAYLINDEVPGAQPLKKEAGKVSWSLALNNIAHKLHLKATAPDVEHANQELSVIGKQLLQDPLKSDIPRKLAQHEERERVYARQIFERFDNIK